MRKRHSAGDPIPGLDDGTDHGYGWIGSVIHASLNASRCPLCEAEALALHGYLQWLPANLREPEFRAEVNAAGSYCPAHLDIAIHSLREHPYSELILLTLVYGFPGRNGGFKIGCHLCHALAQTEAAYSEVLRDLLVAGGGSGMNSSCLCAEHAEILAGRATSQTDTAAAIPKQRYVGLQQKLDRLNANFHLMSRSELIHELRCCENMVREMAKLEFES